MRGLVVLMLAVAPSCTGGAIEPDASLATGADGGSPDGGSMEPDGASSDAFVSGPCSPVDVGAGGSFSLEGPIREMIADVDRCRVYALRTVTPAEVIAFDVTSHTEIGRVVLDQPADDMDLSPGGVYLVVGITLSHQIAVIDLDPFGGVRYTLTNQAPASVKVTDEGRAFYGTSFEYSQLVHSVELAAGIPSDEEIGTVYTSYSLPTLELDGRSLYVAECCASRNDLVTFDVTGPPFAEDPVIDSGWERSFVFPERHIYLPRGTHDLYWGGYRIDARFLKTVWGRVGQRVLAGDSAGTFVVTPSALYDVSLVRPVTPLHEDVRAAAVIEDREVWTWHAETALVRYRHLDDLLAGATLGAHERPPAALDSYSFSQLLHDPALDELYGLDLTRQVVVVLDGTSLVPIRELASTSNPTSIAPAIGGGSILIGHGEATVVGRAATDPLAYEGAIVTRLDTKQVVGLAGGLIATINRGDFAFVHLYDGATGTAIETETFYSREGDLSATADGRTLFSGEAHSTNDRLVRYDLIGGVLVRTDWTDPVAGFGSNGGVRAVPDGSGVFFARRLVDANDLSTVRYVLGDEVITVTPDSLLAVSDDTVYRVADGSVAGTLPLIGDVQAVSPDSTTLYVATPPTISTVDLTVYR